jgi:hypothetical protein
MRTVAPAKRWARAVAVIGVLTILHAVAPAAHAERLIRIGPQALVVEDDRGNVTMAEEPQPDRHDARRVAVGLGAMFVIGAGVFLLLEGQYGYTLQLGGPNTNVNTR